MSISPDLTALIDRMTEKQRRLFACDCAEHVIHWYEKRFPKVKSIHLIIDVGRQYANGKISRQELMDEHWGMEVIAYNAQYDGTDAAGSAMAAVESALYYHPVETDTEVENHRESVVWVVKYSLETVEIAAVGAEAFDLMKARGEDAISREKLQRLRAAQTEEQKWQIERATFYVSG